MARGGDYDFTDVGGLIEHEHHRGLQLRQVKGSCTTQTLLLGDREQQLYSDRWWLLAVTCGKFDKDGDRSLVVSSEDCLSGTPVDAVIEHNIDLTIVRNGVKVSTEGDPGVSLSWYPGEQVPAPGIGWACRIIFIHSKPEALKLGTDKGCNCCLLSSWTGYLTQPGEPAQAGLPGKDRNIPGPSPGDHGEPESGSRLNCAGPSATSALFNLSRISPLAGLPFAPAQCLSGSGLHEFPEKGLRTIGARVELGVEL